MMSSIFWDKTPYSPLKVNRRFGGTCRLYLLTTCFHSDFFLALVFGSEDGGDLLLQNVG
jgi:hypothetical protein